MIAGAVARVLPCDAGATVLQGGTPMLVLARRENERIRIGDDIEIVVVSIRGNSVRLGIKAPSSVPVHREEIYEQRSKEGGGEHQP